MSLKQQLTRRKDSRKEREQRIARLRDEMEAVSKRQWERSDPGANAPPRRSRGGRTTGGGGRVDVIGTALLPGTLTDTPHGEVHLIDHYLEPHHHHGAAPVAAATKVSGSLVAELALDPAFEGLDLSQALFLDTETTGLAGGTGTVPFLIGLAWFEDQSLRVQQMFLRDFGEEEPMLRLLSSRLQECSCLVSYNGKSFDWPLLRNRFVINRVHAPNLPPHLDLLHCARRIFKPRLMGTRLVDLEREVMQMYRQDDIPGSMIPSLYFEYVDGSGPEPLLGVFEHNANDLIALAALLAKLASHFEEVRASDDPRDHLAYARVAERAGNAERAIDFARAAAGGGGSAECTVEAFMLQARLARRQGELSIEEQALIDALAAASNEGQGAQVRLALAKLYEHRVKDLARALEHAPYTYPAEAQTATQLRVQRLERRLGG